MGGYTVYNLTVERDHTFFVGTNGGGTWVHNEGACDWAERNLSGKLAAESADALQKNLVKEARKLIGTVLKDVHEPTQAGRLPHVEGEGWSVNINGSWHDPGTKVYGIPSKAVKALKNIGWPLPEGY